MTMRRAAVLFTVLLAAIGLGQTRPAFEPPTSRPGATSRPQGGPATLSGFARRVAAAHGVKAWRTKEAVRADLLVEFGGREALRGTMLYDLRGGRVRMDLSDGRRLVFDGERAWVGPEGAETGRARFHLLTWPYFLAAPFKLADPGTRLRGERLRMHGDKLYETARLTFRPGTGDTPDDWYVLYADQASARLHMMAYIVTFGTETAEAQAKPHAIVYEGFEEHDGVTLSTEWSFFDWNEEQGPHGDRRGRAWIRNVSFVGVADDTFLIPAGAKEDPLPAAPPAADSE